MRYIHIASVGGLFHEFYNPVPNGLYTMRLKCSENELDATNFFWSLIFDIASIQQLLSKIKPISPKHIAILSNTKLFIKQVIEAKKCICRRDLTQQDFFRYLETLSIVCDLYSEYVFYPHRLTIQNGFDLDCYSASKIYHECLVENQNPYLKFVKLYIIPHIVSLQPDIIFIDGAPTYYNMSVCRLIKKKFPNIHISLTRHSSEYYSLNKIEAYLIKNKYLFRMVDSVILEFFSETEDKLTDAIEKKYKLSQIPNLIYKDGNSIKMTSYSISQKAYLPDIQEPYAGSELINVHLQPNVMCYWNKCSFCGINKKYHFINPSIEKDDDLEKSLKNLKDCIDEQVKYIWFIDEAIHPSKLEHIANFFINNRMNIRWQARCRIEKILLNKNLIMVLQKSGLTELRLGLESASADILKSMNKFNQDFSLDLVNEICAKYSEAGISIHFPMIIGFPGETAFELSKTYNYLKYLCSQFPLVSFNINIFNLDISSYVFSHPGKFGIDEISYPCPLNDFLGNTLQWKRNNTLSLNHLYKERDRYMRDILYPWMPKDSHVKPYLFYRLSETIRNTLIWKSQKDANKDNKLNMKKKLIVPTALIYGYDSNRNIYVIYNWTTHHYMIGNKHMIAIFDLFKEAHSLQEAIYKLNSYNSEIYTSEDLELLLPKLFQQGYLIEK